MSRIGQAPITIPEEVNVTLGEDEIIVKGPKGQLSQKLHRLVRVDHQDSNLTFKRTSETKLAKSLHGTFRVLVANMISGVTDGYEKHLDLVGTGYRVNKQGEKINLTLGFSHPIDVSVPQGIEVKVEGNNKITVSGIDKQAVGQFTASIRALRPPEPYKGKGVRYRDEVVRRKAGKAAKTAA